MRDIIKFLMISDILVISSVSLVSPIIAIFIESELIGGSIAAAGITASIYLISKSLSEPIFGKISDKYGYKKLLLLGSFMMASVPFMLVYTETVTQIFIVQIFGGIGAAISYPGWYALFSNYIDHDKAGYEWGFYDFLVGISSASAAVIGGILAEIIGFRSLFLIYGAMILAGALVLTMIKEPRYYDIKIKHKKIKLRYRKKL